MKVKVKCPMFAKPHDWDCEYSGNCEYKDKHRCNAYTGTIEAELVGEDIIIVEKGSIAHGRIPNAMKAQFVEDLESIIDGRKKPDDNNAKMWMFCDKGLVESLIKKYK